MSDAIERAKRRAEQWAALAEEHARAPSYLHLSPAQLIELAQSPKRLRSEELEALDAAWFATFGETLTVTAGEAEQTERHAQATEEPPEDSDGLSAKEVARLLGVSLSTLQRMVDDGRFPHPRRIGKRRNSWPAGDVKAWLDKVDCDRLMRTDRARRKR